MTRWALPYLKTDAAQLCTEDAPCCPPSTCARCDAMAALTERDWYAIGFFRCVGSQYVTQGHTREGRPVTTPRLEGFEAALRIYGYPRRDWEWLVEWSSFLMRAIYSDDAPTLPLRFRDVTVATFAPPGGVDE